MDVLQLSNLDGSVLDNSIAEAFSTGSFSDLGYMGMMIYDLQCSEAHDTRQAMPGFPLFRAAERMSGYFVPARRLKRVCWSSIGGCARQNRPRDWECRHKGCVRNLCTVEPCMISTDRQWL